MEIVRTESSPDAQLERALGIAFAYLNRRERTRHEMRERLLRAGIEPDGAERAIEALGEQGYLDDLRFARLFAEDKRLLEQWGTERIRRQLVTRGVDRETIDAVLDEESTGGGERTAHDAELARAAELLERRFPRGVADRREGERALGMLMRKGYEYELAREAITSHRGGG